MLKGQEDRRAIAQHRALIDAAEFIVEVMEKHGVNQTELATKAGLSKGRISQILCGSQNLTVKTLAAVLFEMDERLEFKSRGLNEIRGRSVRIESSKAGWPEGAGCWNDPYSRPKLRIAA